MAVINDPYKNGGTSSKKNPFIVRDNQTGYAREPGKEKKGRVGFTGFSEERDTPEKTDLSDVRYYPGSKKTYESKSLGANDKTFREVQAGKLVGRKANPRGGSN